MDGWMDGCLIAPCQLPYYRKGSSSASLNQPICTHRPQQTQTPTHTNRKQPQHTQTATQYGVVCTWGLSPALESEVVGLAKRCASQPLGDAEVEVDQVGEGVGGGGGLMRDDGRAECKPHVSLSQVLPLTTCHPVNTQTEAT